jgi:hypothetical protein
MPVNAQISEPSRLFFSLLVAETQSHLFCNLVHSEPTMEVVRQHAAVSASIVTFLSLRIRASMQLVFYAYIRTGLKEPCET